MNQNSSRMTSAGCPVFPEALSDVARAISRLIAPWSRGSSASFSTLKNNHGLSSDIVVGLSKSLEYGPFSPVQLRSWTGEKGPYSRLFDRPTTISLDNPWLFFNVEKLADDPRLQGAMSLLIARATSERASGKTGQPALVILDEFWFILDSPVLAPEAVQLY